MRSTARQSVLARKRIYKEYSNIAATNTGTTTTLSLAKLPLTLELRELRLFSENLVPSLLHFVAALQWPISVISRLGNSVEMWDPGTSKASCPKGKKPAEVLVFSGKRLAKSQLN